MSASIHRLHPIPSRGRRTLEVSDYATLFIEHHQAMGNSPKTIEHYQNSLTLFQRCFDTLDTDEPFTNQVMNAFAAYLRETPTKLWRGKTTRSIYGIHGALKDVKVWVRWLEAEDHIYKAPKVPVPRLPQRLFPILSEDDLELIFSCRILTDRSEQADRNRALIAFMLDTAVRLSEAANVTIDDLKLKEGTALIRGKGNKERLVFFSDNVAAEIRRWLSIRGWRMAHSFGSKRPASGSSIAGFIWKQDCRCLRRTRYATLD